MHAFSKCFLLPVQPPTKDDNVSGGIISVAIQCAEGKKATELCIIQPDTLATLLFSVEQKSNVDTMSKVKPKLCAKFFVTFCLSQHAVENFSATFSRNQEISAGAPQSHGDKPWQ